MKDVLSRIEKVERNIINKIEDHEGKELEAMTNYQEVILSMLDDNKDILEKSKNIDIRQSEKIKKIGKKVNYLSFWIVGITIILCILILK